MIKSIMPVEVWDRGGKDAANMLTRLMSGLRVCGARHEF